MNPPPAMLQVEGVGVRFELPRRTWWRRAPALDALEDVSLVLQAGRRLGIVGESGSGKSTLARVVLGLTPARTGRVLWDGIPVAYDDPVRLRVLRREVQVVFQDPFGSLDPRMTAGQAVDEALQALCGPVPRAEARRRIAGALEEVGLASALAGRYPHELSGGQCQRVAIARATVARPRLLVCDEAVSALDVSVQAQVVNLLWDLSERHGMALMFISHNLAVVRHLCQEVVVLAHGRLVEQGDCLRVMERPAASYTRSLLAAVPSLVPARRARAPEASTSPPALADSAGTDLDGRRD